MIVPGLVIYAYTGDSSTSCKHMYIYICMNQYRVEYDCIAPSYMRCRLL